MAPGWLEKPVLRSSLQMSSRLESADERAALEEGERREVWKPEHGLKNNVLK